MATVEISGDGKFLVVIADTLLMVVHVYETYLGLVPCVFVC